MKSTIVTAGEILRKPQFTVERRVPFNVVLHNRGVEPRDDDVLAYALTLLDLVSKDQRRLAKVRELSLVSTAVGHYERGGTQRLDEWEVLEPRKQMYARMRRKPLLEPQLAQLKIGRRVSNEQHVEMLRDRPDEIDDAGETIAIEYVLVPVDRRDNEVSGRDFELDAAAVLETEPKRVDLGVPVRVQLGPL